MKILIMGCGRVGEQLARLMAAEGHGVVVIDSAMQALERLGTGFKGQKTLGVGFDRDVLLRSGIEQADAFAATSSSDNANIIAARIARDVFRVPRVVARLYDPRRAEIYRRMGLLTISSTTWGAERIRELVTHSDFDPLIMFGSGEVSLLALEAPRLWAGQQVRDVSIPGEILVVAITRQGRAFIPVSGSEIQANDTLHLALQASSMQHLKALLGIGEGV